MLTSTCTWHYLLNFVQRFYASVDRNMWLFLWKLLIWWMTLLLSNRWCNSTCCGWFILFIPGCIQLDNILLRVFVPMLIKSFWIVVFLYCLLFFFFFNILFSVLFKYDNFYWLQLFALSPGFFHWAHTVNILFWLYFSALKCSFGSYLYFVSFLSFPIFPLIHSYFLGMVIYNI